MSVFSPWTFYVLALNISGAKNIKEPRLFYIVEEKSTVSLTPKSISTASLL
jgi:hypothetical protein